MKKDASFRTRITSLNKCHCYRGHAHVYVFPDHSVYCLHTCESNMCAELNDYIPQISRLCLGCSVFVLFFYLQKKEQRKQKPTVCVIVRDLTGKNHPATRALLRMFCFQSRIQADQLFPYIDLPAIILSSNVLNNRALSETAITGKPCDNRRSAVWLSAAKSEGHAGSLHLTMQIIIQNRADK